MLITEKRTNLLFNLLVRPADANGDVEYCGKYGEPGYTDPVGGILFANWNNVWAKGTKHDIAVKYLEQAGFEFEWSDEWFIDYDNDKAYRTSPDSYGWEQQIRFTECGDVLTPDDPVEAWIDEMCITFGHFVNNCLPSRITQEEIEAEGYERFEHPDSHYENGWYDGQSDKPEEIAKKAFAAGAEKVVFRLDRVGQFDIHYECYVKYGENDENQDE